MLKLLASYTLGAVLLFAFYEGNVWAQGKDKSDASGDVLQNCAYYRAKKDGTAVFREAKRTSEVIYRLSQGELVCHIGERGEFAIIDWRLQDKINKREESTPEDKKQELAFVRLVELWEDPISAPGAKQQDMVEQVKQYFYYMRYGGVPEDVMGPFRPFIDPLLGPPECKAGKLCEKIKEEEKKRKEEEEKAGK